MKELPDEQKMLEMLEVIKSAEQAARELCDLSTMMALKYQKLAGETRAKKQQQPEVVE